LTTEVRTQAASSRVPFAVDAFGRALRRYAIFIILAALVVFFHQAEPAFLHVNNLFSVLQSVAVVALLAVGVTVTLAVDGFDLSVGSIAAFSLMLSSYAMVVLQLGAPATVAFALMTGAAIGLVNGLLIVGLHIPDLLATLGMMFLLAGLQLIPSAGRSITTGLILSDGSVARGAFDPVFLAIGRYQLFGVAPLPVVVVAVIAVVFWFLMERTRWGRVFYAVGGNETAAYLAGAPVKALAHIHFTELLAMDKDSVLQDTWITAYRAQWAARRAAASVGPGDGGAWLTGESGSSAGGVCAGGVCGGVDC